MEWKVEEMKLMNQEKCPLTGKKVYNEESLPKEEKIEFLDKIYEGKISQMIDLVERFEKDRDVLPKDNYGYVKTVSLKAWIKRNDKNNLTKTHRLGEFRIGDRNITYFNSGNSYDRYSNAIDQMFYNELRNLEYKEKRYFLSTDKYSVLKSELRKKTDRNDCFNLGLVFSSNGEISISKNGDWEDLRPVTIEEIEYILKKYEEVENFIKSLNVELKY